MKRLWTGLAIGAVAVGMLVSPVSAAAGVLKIWPDQFKSGTRPLNSTSTATVYQDPTLVGLYDLDPDMLQCWAPVNLRVGTTIKSVVYYEDGISSGLTVCELLSKPFVKDATLLSRADSSSRSPKTVTLVPTDPATPIVIKQDVRYFVRIRMSSGTEVRGVKINY